MRYPKTLTLSKYSQDLREKNPHERYYSWHFEERVKFQIIPNPITGLFRHVSVHDTHALGCGPGPAAAAGEEPGPQSSRKAAGFGAVAAQTGPPGDEAIE